MASRSRTATFGPSTVFAAGAVKISVLAVWETELQRCRIFKCMVLRTEDVPGLRSSDIIIFILIVSELVDGDIVSTGNRVM